MVTNTFHELPPTEGERASINFVGLYMHVYNKKSHHMHAHFFFSCKVKADS